MKKDCNNLSLLTDKPFVTPLFRVMSRRIHGLDFLRGMCVILMILDHVTYDITSLPFWSDDFFGTAPDFLLALYRWVTDTLRPSLFRQITRYTVVTVFFVLSGISSSFSRNNFLRGGKLAAAAIVLSLVTVIGDRLFDMGITILFGVLHCLTVCILLYSLFELLLGNKAKYACLGIGILLFVWGLLLDFANLQLHHDLSGQQIGFTDFLGIVAGTRYYGADCFGLVPYAGIFLIGVYGGKTFYPPSRRFAYVPLFRKKPFRPICFIGRKAVWFYLLHQPVVLVCMLLLCAACGIPLF